VDDFDVLRVLTRPPEKNKNMPIPFVLPHRDIDEQRDVRIGRSSLMLIENSPGNGKNVRGWEGQKSCVLDQAMSLDLRAGNLRLGIGYYHLHINVMATDDGTLRGPPA
jgi:hypothetical protein